jgi:Right handed beta helix region
LSTIITSDFTFEKGHFYTAENDVAFTGNVQINKAIILTADNKEIAFLGKVTMGSFSGYARFLSLKRGDFWDGIKVESEGNTFSQLIIKDARDGVQVKANNNFIENTYIKNSVLAGIVISNQLKNNNINNVLISKQKQGIVLSLLDSTNIIQNSIICYSSAQGGDLFNTSALIINNMFLKNNIGLQAFFNSDIILEHCNFEGNLKYEIQIGGSDPVIRYNNFKSFALRGVFISIVGYAGNSQPVINYNNLLNSEYLIYIIGSMSSPNEVDIDASKNWWNNLNDLAISQRIFDKNDIDVTDAAYNSTGIINYLPMEKDLIISAGIHN